MRSKGPTDLVVVVGINLVFLVVGSALLWPLGGLSFAVSLAKGFALLWSVTWVSVLILSLVEKVAKIDPDEHERIYLATNALVSIMLVAGWSAFVALTVDRLVASTLLWIAIQIVALLSCYVAFVVVTEFYRGGFYKVLALPTGMVGYLVFSIWPAAGRFLFGRLFGFLAAVLP